MAAGGKPCRSCRAAGQARLEGAPPEPQHTPPASCIDNRCCKQGMQAAWTPPAAAGCDSPCRLRRASAFHSSGLENSRADATLAQQSSATASRPADFILQAGAAATGGSCW